MLTAAIAPIALLCATALVALLLGRSERAALAAGSAGTALACALGLAASLFALVRGEHAGATLPWALPLGALHVGLDPLSAFFLVCVFLVSGLASVYGAGYLRPHRGALGSQGGGVAQAIVFFDLLVASMVGVVVARDAVLFLMAWEVMSIASFFLVTFEHERAEVRRAGITYLIASHAGVACLFVLFGLLAQGPAGFDFDRLAAPGASTSLSAGMATAAFVLAIFGFGTKAGFWPVHVWLPDAHPAAPSHVSALMSGVMIKMGIYGLLRTLTFLGPPPPHWGAALVGIGAISGVVGIVHALAQHDLKRLLAYSSVENVGVITLGIGIGVLGRAYDHPAVASLGFAGALLHVLNHGLFKGLLFQCAGAVLHATGTRDIDALGGLARRMRLPAAAFALGAVAISALPPLNGFVSELVIYVGAFRGAADLPPAGSLTALAILPSLALIGGLAAASFVKAYGLVFLGEPRTELASAHGAERPSSPLATPFFMRLSMVLGALLCVAIGVWPAGAIALVSPAVAPLAGMPGGALAVTASIADKAASVSHVALLLVALVAALALLRSVLLRGREVTSEEPTWGCGYSAPTARMQYTSSSFAEPVLRPFSPMLGVSLERTGPEGFFPATAHHEERVTDLAGERLLVPAVRATVRLLGRLRVLQQGRVQLYLGYVFATLIALLVWQLGFGG